MKRYSNRLLFVVLLLFPYILPLNSATIRIMGIGDSITEGGVTFTSYMEPLAHLLDESGFDYEFVGVREGFSAGIHYRHAAFGGRNTEFIAERIDSIYRACPADIVLIHSGHNHFIKEKPVQGIVEAHRSIIQKIKEINPKVVVLVAGVINSGKLPKYSYLSDLNYELERMVSDMHDAHIRYVFVGDGFDWRIHAIEDKVHPNMPGAYVMACNWYKVLNQILLE